MAIISQFVRESRFLEVDACPLAAPHGNEDESSCLRCPYNVASPTEARVGCVASTRHEDYRQMMQRLAQLSPVDQARLSQILEANRRQGAESGLAVDAVREVYEIADRWSHLLADGQAERSAALLMVRFAAASLSRREPVRIFA